MAPGDDDLRLRALAELELEHEATPRAPTPLSMAQADAPSGAFLKSVPDVANGLMTTGAEIAGATLAPELLGPLKAIPYLGALAPQEVAAGIGPLKTVLGYLRNAIPSAVGNEVGKEGAEAGGISPDTSLYEKMVSALENTALGTVGGYGLDRLARGSNTAKFANELDPQVQRAAGLGSRITNSADQPLPELVDLANKRAADLPGSVSAELGANAGMNAEQIATGERTRNAISEAQQLGIFGAPKDTNELAQLVEQKMSDVNTARAQALDSHGSTPVQTPDVKDAYDSLTARIQKLSKTPGTAPLADAIQSERDRIMGSLNTIPQTGKPRTVADLVDIYQNLNEQRRVLIQEFNKANAAAGIKGDTFEHEGSIEAIRTMQQGIDNAIRQATGSDIFSALNKQQEALSAIGEQAGLFNRGIAEGRAVRPASRLIQTPAQQSGPAPGDVLADAATGGKSSMLRSAFQAMFPGEAQVAPQLQTALKIENSGTNAMTNIRDLMSLNENPAPQLIAAPGAPLGGRAAQATIGATDIRKAVSDLAPVVSQMFPQQAQAQPVLFPRDTQTLLQNPDAFMHAVAQASGGSPQLMQDVQTALREPNQAKREMALAQLTQMLPQLFEPTPYKSLWNGRITDPAEVPLYVDALKTQHRSGSIDANFLAKAMSAANADGSVTPTPPPTPPIQAGQPYSVIPPRRVGTGAPREYAY